MSRRVVDVDRERLDGWIARFGGQQPGNQADALVGAVRDHLVRILDGQPAPGALLVGGDKALAADVLTDPRVWRRYERCLSGRHTGLPTPTGR